MITLAELKTWLKIEGTTKDTFLPQLIDQVTDFIEGMIGKKIISRSFTEYHNGLGKENILARNYPVYKVSSLHDDTEHGYGDADLIAVDDYRIDYDVGNIELTNDETIFSNGVGNVKIVYWAGFSRFNLVDESNNYLDVYETSTNNAAIELTPPTTPDDTKYKGYTAEDFASDLQTALRANTDLTLEYNVSYNHNTQKFTFSAATDFDLQFYTGINAAKSMASLLGYSTSTDTNIGTSHVSDDAVNGIPWDLKTAAFMICQKWLSDSPEGGGNLLNTSKTLPQGGGTFSLITGMPERAKQILEQYTAIML